MLQYIEISNVTGVLLYLWKKKISVLNWKNVDTKQ